MEIKKEILISEEWTGVTKADVSSVSLSSEPIEELWVVRVVKGERMSSAIGGVPSIFIFFLPTRKTETPKRF